MALVVKYYRDVFENPVPHMLDHQVHSYWEYPVYDTLKATLEEVEKGHYEYGAKAHKMLIQLRIFNTFYGLKH